MLKITKFNIERFLNILGNNNNHKKLRYDTHKNIKKHSIGSSLTLNTRKLKLLRL